MAWQVIAAGTYFVLQPFYHRWVEDWLGWGPEKPKPAREMSIPRVDEGAPVPLVYGRCRVRAPVIAWTGSSDAFLVEQGEDSNYPDDVDTFYYTLDLFFLLGIPFLDGINRVRKMWVGESELHVFVQQSTVALHDLTGDGGFEHTAPANRLCKLSSRGFDSFNDLIEGEVEFLNGKSTQELCEQTPPYAALTVAGRYMTEIAYGGTLDGTRVPGYRGYMSIFLANSIGTSSHWLHGRSPSVAQYSYEVSSYPATELFAHPGDEANPADVILDVLTGTFGKLGLSTTLIDYASFTAAAGVLYREEQGYSRAIEDGRPAAEIIQEILIQIDGVLYEDHADGLFKLYLIRPDFNPLSILHLTKANCKKITGAARGRTDLVNRLRLTYSNRLRDYQDDSVIALDSANAVGQNGIVNEVTINMPGVCTEVLARAMAARELAANSRPLMRLRVEGDRTLMGAFPGMPVKVTWNKPDISGLIFRVGTVDLGSLEDGKVILDLVQDYYFTFRNQAPQHPPGSTVGDVNISIGS